MWTAYSRSYSSSLVVRWKPLRRTTPSGGEVGAVLGDEVEEAGAARTAGAGEADGTAAGEQPDELFALLLTADQAEHGRGGAGRHGRPGGSGRLGALGRGGLRGPFGALGGRAQLDLAAVDGVDGEQEIAGDQLGGAGRDGRRVLAEVGCEGGPWTGAGATGGRRFRGRAPRAPGCSGP
ncbi:hypothetical protein GCM10020256_22750 [Streptomyces thermocoprophilus]